MLFSHKLSVAFALVASLLAAPALGQVKAKRDVKPPANITAKKEIVPDKKLDIVETVTKAGSFKTLATALEAAGLDQTLKGKGPFTLFAPTDEAFAKLPSGTLETWLKPANKQKLVAILTYHVLPADEKADDVMKMDTCKTVNGELLAIKMVGDDMMVNHAKATKSNIACTNGTIHVIDTVLMPQE